MSLTANRDAPHSAGSVPTKVVKDEHTAKELLASIVESSHDAIFSTTLNGCLVTWNKASEHIFGYSAAEVLG